MPQPVDPRSHPPSRLLAALTLCAALIAPTHAGPGAGAFKLAFYNIKSGKGQIALGGSGTFADTINCVDNRAPLNAWGVGAVQATLRAEVAADPAIVALGLAEAWTCATAAAVRTVLGWRASSSERNGVAIIARHGFAGPEQWFQLDTRANRNPNDTMWVLRVPVCLDATCSDSVVTFTAHWYGDGLMPALTREAFNTQAQQTVDLLNLEAPAAPHILLGDLNVFEGEDLVCTQAPQNAAVRKLRAAGLVDAWTAVNGAVEGFTGMWNRAGCGTPAGNLWKRIDYAWARNIRAVSMARFGMVTPGREAPSDHAGIVVEYTLAPEPPAPPPPAAAAPFGSLDTPADGSTASGEVALTGWGLDDSGLIGVDLFRTPVDGEAVQPNGLVMLGSATLVAGARPDIARDFASYPGAERAGWGYMLLSNMLPAGGNGVFTVSAYAHAIDGGTTLLGSKTISAANASARTPFGSIDTPLPGQTVSGVITNFGWALTPLPNRIPTDGSTIDVIVDGEVRGHPVYNHYRPDVAGHFPGYANSSGAVGYFTIDTRPLTNGVHTISWVVRDNAGNAAGMGSRYFTVRNP